MYLNLFFTSSVCFLDPKAFTMSCPNILRAVKELSSKHIFLLSYFLFENYGDREMQNYLECKNIN